MIVLGIESSCDETAAAFVRDGREILASLVSSQVDLHRPYGGVVPEIASRTHLDTMHPLLDELCAKAGLGLADADGFAVTNRPGLIGSLLVGMTTAKTLAYFYRKPLIGVHHVEAHLFSTVVENPGLRYPYLSLVVSGGHSSLYVAKSPLESELIGQTVDDAAGEAFDKVAAILGLPYPGGPSIETAAKSGDRKRVSFKAPKTEKPFDFSFSGLKTAVLYHVRGQDGKRVGQALSPAEVANVSASFQETVVERLVQTSIAAAKQHGLTQIGVGGGVACNMRLSERMDELCRANGMESFFPSKHMCLDNGAMIAGLGYHLLHTGRRDTLDLDASAR